MSGIVERRADGGWQGRANDGKFEENKRPEGIVKLHGQGIAAAATPEPEPIRVLDQHAPAEATRQAAEATKGPAE